MSRKIVVSLGALLLLGCATENSPPDDGSPLFLALKDRPAMFMDALFDGTVTVDGEGCIRLGLEPDRHTVIWPFRATLTQQGTELVVRDEGGVELGRIGERFRLGGGEIAALQAGLVQSGGHEAAALARCPGRYWIVAGQ